MNLSPFVDFASCELILLTIFDSLKNRPMKLMKILIVGVVLLFIGSCKPKESEKPPKAYTIQQFMDVVQVTGGAFSSDETKVLISSKVTGIFNAVEINIETGEQKPLTTSTNNAIFAYSYFPKDDRILYGSD